jgi:DNA-directed RNA polymerase specialized sigma24 family protein
VPTKAVIIQTLYESKEINQAISKMQPAELRDDLKQEMFLVLCELSDDKVEDMYERNVLKYYVVRMMLNMMTGRRSSFEKKFRQVFTEILEEPEGKGFIIEDTGEHHEFIDRVVKVVEGMHFYEAGLLKLYAEHNRNAMEVSRKTNIPYRSVYPVIKEAKLKIINKLKK